MHACTAYEGLGPGPGLDAHACMTHQGMDAYACTHARWQLGTHACMTHKGLNADPLHSRAWIVETWHYRNHVILSALGRHRKEARGRGILRCPLLTWQPRGNGGSSKDFCSLQVCVGVMGERGDAP